MDKDTAVATITLILAPMINANPHIQNPIPSIRQVIEQLERDSKNTIRLQDWDD
jgi:hypothetical protein